MTMREILLASCAVLTFGSDGFAKSTSSEEAASRETTVQRASVRRSPATRESRPTEKQARLQETIGEMWSWSGQDCLEDIAQRTARIQNELEAVANTEDGLNRIDMEILENTLLVELGAVRERGNVLCRAHRFDEALEHYQEALTMAMDVDYSEDIQDELHFLIGKTYLNLRRLDDAAQIFDALWINWQAHSQSSWGLDLALNTGFLFKSRLATEQDPQLRELYSERLRESAQTGLHYLQKALNAGLQDRPRARAFFMTFLASAALVSPSTPIEALQGQLVQNLIPAWSMQTEGGPVLTGDGFMQLAVTSFNYLKRLFPQNNIPTKYMSALRSALDPSNPRGMDPQHIQFYQCLLDQLEPGRSQATRTGCKR